MVEHLTSGQPEFKTFAVVRVEGWRGHTIVDNSITYRTPLPSNACAPIIFPANSELLVEHTHNWRGHVAAHL